MANLPQEKAGDYLERIGLQSFFYSDQPHNKEPAYGTDELDFQYHTQVLGGKLLTTEGPFTVGIHGSWGTGKTTFCRILREQIRSLAKASRTKVLTLEFNAWQYQREQHPILAMLGVLADGLDQKPAFSRMANMVRALIFSTKVGLNGQVPFLGGVKADVNLGEAIKREEELNRQIIDKSLFQKAWEQLVGVMENEKEFRLFFFIDDLDRCPPDNALNLIEQIKLVLNLPKTIFILALDKAVLERFVSHRYRELFQQPGFSVDRLIDKLIQLHVELPLPKTNLKAMIEKMLLAHADIDTRNWTEESLKEIVSMITRSSNGNPRTATRLINRLLYLQSFAEMNVETLLMFVFQEGLQVLAPRFFKELMAHEIHKDFLLNRLSESPVLQNFIAEFEADPLIVGHTCDYLKLLLEKDEKWKWLMPFHPLHPEKRWLPRHEPVPLMVSPSQLASQTGQFRLFDLWDHHLGQLRDELKKRPPALGPASRKLEEILDHLLVLPQLQENAAFFNTMIRHGIDRLGTRDPENAGYSIPPQGLDKSLLEKMAQLVGLITRLIPDDLAKLRLLLHEQTLTSWLHWNDNGKMVEVLSEQIRDMNYFLHLDVCWSDSFYLFALSLRSSLQRLINNLKEEVPLPEDRIQKFSMELERIKQIIHLLDERLPHVKTFYTRGRVVKDVSISES